MISLKSWFENWEAFSEIISGIESFKSYSFSCVGETSSTNDDLKNDWIRFPPPPRIHVTAHQTAGRGSFGRKWVDNPDQSLLFSFSWLAKSGEIDGLPLQMLVGIAVHRALEKKWSGWPRPWLKWPNDIWVGNTKVGGILVETTAMEKCHAFVIGVGINFKGKPEESFENPAGSLADFGFQGEVWNLLENILVEWDQLMMKDGGKFWESEYMIRGKEFFARTLFVQDRDDEGFLPGKPIEIDKSGGLWVKIESKKKVLIQDARKIRLDQ